MNISTFRTQRKSQKGLVQLLRQGNLLCLACIACLSLLLWAQGTQAQTVTTYATGFDGPGRVSFDAAGNMYVPEVNTGLINKVTLGGSTTTTLATGMSNPRSIALDATDNLYVADNGLLGGSANTSLWKVTPAGVLSTFVNIGANTNGIVKDAAGNFYVTRASPGNDVRKITPDGTITTFATGFTFPWHLDIDAAGNLYVNSANSRKILKVTPAGVVSTFYDYSASGASCSGVALDAAGNVYLSFSLRDFSNFPTVTSYFEKSRCFGYQHLYVC